ncbi:BON domain-containing protein [Desulfococcus sp.]|uniref:BON domain-containing protein n=1 Tax=Desulfococcus sp. TaxID=2025834 RepID=UPI003592FFF0
MSLLHRGFFIVLLLSFALVLPGCQQEGTAEKAGKKVDQAAEKVSEQAEKAGEAVSEKAEETAEYMDDAAITAKIKMDILGDPLLKVSEINVTTTNGAVNLSGVVESQQSIDRAMEIVRSVKSVKSIENGLVVKTN